MHIKPLKHVQFTSVQMNRSARRSSVFIVLIITSLIVDRSQGDPQSQLIKLSCSQELPNNQMIFASNFLQSTEKIGFNLLTSHRGTTSTGVGLDSNYTLVECYSDLSREDCILCYYEAHTLLSSCFPYNGQVFLDGCFMRTQNYSFYQENAGPDDTVICGNTTRKGVNQDSVRQAISDAVRDTPTKSDYFTGKVALSGTVLESAYVMANYWKTLNISFCRECLKRASTSIFQCFPLSDGRALHTESFMRYSDTNFLSAGPTEGVNGEGDAYAKPLLLGCGIRQVNNTIKKLQLMKMQVNYFHAMEDIRTKMQTSRSGTTVTVTNPDGTYGLAQCFGDRSTSECLFYYAIAHATFYKCLPDDGGRVYLSVYFMQFEMYNFLGEKAGPDSISNCTHNTMTDNAFEKSARKVVLQAVKTAPKKQELPCQNRNPYLCEGKNKNYHAVADCWSTLDADSCRTCLRAAGKSMLECLPTSSGLAMYTGCFMRYSDSNSSYPDHKRLSKGKWNALLYSLFSRKIALSEF